MYFHTPHSINPAVTFRKRKAAAFKAMWKDEASIPGIAKALGVSFNTVRRRAVEMGLLKSPNAWPQPKIDRLAHMWQVEGLSASVIADELGCTRNAVIGKLGRLDLLGKRVAPATNYVRPTRPKAEPIKIPVVVGNDPPVRLVVAYVEPTDDQPETFIEESMPVVLTAARSLLDLEPGMCRWPVEDSMFCSSPTVGPRVSYCACHANEGTRPSERLKRGPRHMQRALPRFAPA